MTAATRKRKETREMDTLGDTMRAPNERKTLEIPVSVLVALLERSARSDDEVAA